MGLDEILDHLETFVNQAKEDIDMNAKEWARTMAKKEHNDDLRKAKLATAKLKFTGSETHKAAMAYTDEEYRKFVDEVKISEDEAYYLQRYLHDHYMERIGVLRSLLSFHKERAKQDV